MKSLLDLLQRLRPWRLTEQQVRAEAWALGTRHKGEILDGALRESRAPNLSLRRAVLLRAVIRSQSPDGR